MVKAPNLSPARRRALIAAGKWDKDDPVARFAKPPPSPAPPPKVHCRCCICAGAANG